MNWTTTEAVVVHDFNVTLSPWDTSVVIDDFWSKLWAHGMDDIMFWSMAIVIVLGVCGNTFGMLVIACCKEIAKEPFAWYLFAVLATDLTALGGMFSILILTTRYNSGAYIISRLCGLRGYIAHVGMVGSGYMMVVSSCERFCQLWFPTRLLPSSTSRVLKLVTGSIVAALITAIPIYWKFSSYETNLGGYVCFLSMGKEPEWLQNAIILVETGFEWLFILILFIPLNIGIVYKMWTRAANKKAAARGGAKDNAREIGTALITACVLQIVLPLSRIVVMFLQFVLNIEVPFIWHQFAYAQIPSLNHTVNFYVFASTWTLYRQAIKRILRCGDPPMPEAANNPHQNQTSPL